MTSPRARRRRSGTPPRRRARGLLAAALAALAACSAPPDPEPATPAHPAGTPVAVIGWDGADWEIVRPLIAEGRMPVLAGLMERGATAELRSMVPALSPLLWTTVATGRPPEIHGVLDFLEPGPDGGEPRPVGRSARRVPALWEMAAASGRTAGVVGWFATHPAQTLPGFMVSDRLAYTILERRGAGAIDGAVQPAELRGSAGVVRAEELEGALPDELAAITSDEGDAGADLRRILAGAMTYHRAALAGLRSGQPDLLLVYFSQIDQASHRFIDCVEPAMASCPRSERGRFHDAVNRIYELQDRMLGELLEALDPDTNLILLSDHGFLSGSRRPAHVPPDVSGKPGRWHRSAGLFVMAGPDVRPGPLAAVDLLDVAPTVLVLLGLPVGKDMEGAPRLDGVRGQLLERRPALSIPSWTGRVELPGPAPGAPPEDEADRRQVEELAALGYVSDAGSLLSSGLRSVAAEVNLASRLTQTDRLDEAHAALRRALERSPDYLPARLALAEVHGRQGRRDLARAQMIRAIELDGGVAADPAIFLRWSMLVGGEGAGTDTARALQRALAARPDSADLHAAHGVLTAGSVGMGAAVPSFRRALELAPTHREAMAGLFAAAEAGAYEPGRLEGQLRRALELEPDGVMTRNWLALLRSRQGATAEAERLLEEAARLAPDHAGTRVNLGVLLARSGRADEAAAQFHAALALDPAEVTAAVGLGTVLARSGRLEEARQVLEAAGAPERSDPRLLNTLAMVERDLGNVDGALAALRASLSARPDQPAVREMLRELESSP